jgi:hypothetical protein
MQLAHREQAVGWPALLGSTMRSNPAKFSNQFIPTLFIFASCLFEYFIYLLRVGFGVLSKALEKTYPYARNSLENRPIPPRKLPPAIHIVSPQQTASDRPFATPPTDIGSSIVRPHVSLCAVAESGERARTYPRRVYCEKREKKSVFYGFWVQNREDWHV